MKQTSILLLAASLSLAAFIASFALSFDAIKTSTVMVSVWVLLLSVQSYSPRRSVYAPRSAKVNVLAEVAKSGRSATLPLAA